MEVQQAGVSHLTGVASQSYNVASIYDKVAVLTDEQQKAVDQLEDYLAERFIQKKEPQSNKDRQDTQVDIGPSQSFDNEPTEKIKGSAQTIQNPTQFLKWYNELESLQRGMANKKYHHYSEKLLEDIHFIDSLLQQVDSSITLLDANSQQVSKVITQTESLHRQTQKLVQEKENKQLLDKLIGDRLYYFQQFDNISQHFMSPGSIMVENQKFIEMLDNIDQCIDYFRSNPSFTEAGSYLGKFKQLQAKAISAIKIKVFNVFRYAAVQMNEHNNQQALQVQRSNSQKQQQQQHQVQLQQQQQVRASSEQSDQSSNQKQAKSQGVQEKEEVNLMVDNVTNQVSQLKFRATIESGIKGLLQQISQRTSKVEYQSLMDECLQMYCEERQLVVLPQVRKQFVKLNKDQPTSKLVQISSTYLSQVCRLECQLFASIFQDRNDLSESQDPYSSKSGDLNAYSEDYINDKSGNQPYLHTQFSQTYSYNKFKYILRITQPLSNLMYDIVRPKINYINELQEICDIIDILQYETSDESDMQTNIQQFQEELQQTYLKLLQDSQERLVYRCQAVFRAQVMEYTPSQLDLNYPKQISKEAQEWVQATLKKQRKEQSDVDNIDNPGDNKQDQQQDKESTPLLENKDQDDMKQFKVHNVVRNSLNILQMLHSRLALDLFGQLASEILAQLCNQESSLTKVGKLIVKQVGFVDGQLFMISQLLIIRAQLLQYSEAPFGFSERDLDMGYLSNNLRSVISSGLSLFNMSSKNALYQLVSGTRVQEHYVDGKRDLEEQLRSSCQHFILTVIRMTAESIVNFLSKVQAIMGSKAQNQKPLKEQAFATVDKVSEVIQRFKLQLNKSLREVTKKLQLYIDDPDAHQVLYRPIKQNLLEQHQNFLNLIRTQYQDVDFKNSSQPLSQAQLIQILDNMF